MTAVQIAAEKLLPSSQVSPALLPNTLSGSVPASSSPARLPGALGPCFMLAPLAELKAGSLDANRHQVSKRQILRCDNQAAHDLILMHNRFATAI